MPQVTQSRTLPEEFPTLREFGVNGQSEKDTWGTLSKQTTTSFRSSEDLMSDLENFTKTTRNGLSTFSSEFDNGHEFFTTKSRTFLSHTGVNLRSADGTAFYRGALRPYPSGFTLERTLAKMDQNEVNLLGSAAIAATRPLQSEASLATLIGELKGDGLPRLTLLDPNTWKPKNHRYAPNTAFHAGGKAGDEYLNYQFGWAPLVKDLLGMMHSVVNVSNIVRQMDRDSGKLIRRRWNSAPNVSNSEIGTFYNGSQGRSNMVPNHVAPYVLNGTGSEGTVLRSSYESTRFAAAYSYYWPEAVTALDKMVEFERRANVVLGTRLTPDVLWNLAPWSWLVDWFGNVGDVISNATALSNDNLVMRYGYLTKKVSVTYSYTCPDVRSNGHKLGSVTTGLINTSLERRRATPYGFGVDLNGLSVAQWAILGALGLTKSPRTLRQVT